MNVKEESEKAGLNSTFKCSDHAIQSHHFMAKVDGETMATVREFCFVFGGGPSKITADGDCSHEIKK